MGMCICEERCHKRKREKGFTLIEIMVAIFILTIGILAVASMQNSSLLGTAKSNAVTQATNVAMDRMERLLCLPFDTWSATGPNPTPHDGDNTFFTGPPVIPESITSISFRVEDGPVWDDSVPPVPTTVDSVPPVPTTVTITVTITPKGMRQIRLTGIKTSL
jgi:type IV pilus assembly protein PilV